MLLHEGEHFTTPIKPAAKNNNANTFGKKPLTRSSGSITRPEVIVATVTIAPVDGHFENISAYRYVDKDAPIV